MYLALKACEEMYHFASAMSEKLVREVKEMAKSCSALRGIRGLPKNAGDLFHGSKMPMGQNPTRGALLFSRARLSA